MRIVADFRLGESQKTVAERYGVCYNLVYKINRDFSNMLGRYGRVKT
jgi:transposase